MRLLSLLTNSTVLLILQQFISIWFLIDFFLARDSFTADQLRKASLKHKSNDHLSEQIQTLTRNIREKHCPERVLSYPTFDKVILIVVDALGSDFIPSLAYPTGIHPTRYRMHFIEKLLRQKKAMGFVARASSPTVTMPRIKAIVSGTVPSYVDILYNLAIDVSKFDSDNILSIAKAHSKSLVFYGDDTWLSLFDKSIFTRYEGTLSFFAGDYTTVDTNVTVKAIPETKLSHIDWDYLILHYLGLDHIGHVYGSNKAPLIRDKLIEMDIIIKTIYENMLAKEEKTLIIVCGDHGMNEDGNHGGSTKLEADTAMIFMPINHEMKDFAIGPGQIRQIDLAATLSYLTGVQVPSSSRGVAVEELLTSLWSDETYRLPCVGLDNVLELVNLTNPLEFKSSAELRELMTLLDDHYWLSENFAKIAHRYFKLAGKIQEKLLRVVATNANPVLVVIVLTCIVFLTLVSLRRTSIRLLMPVISRNEQIMCLLTFISPIFMHGSTNFIENEHIFWPIYSLISFIMFLLIAINARQFVKNNLDKFRVVLFVITFLITISWNHLRLFRNVSEFTLPLFSVAILFNSIRQISDLRMGKKPFAFLLAFLIMLSKHLEEGANYDNIEISLYRIFIQRLTVILIVIHTAINVFSQPSKDKLSHGSSLLISKLGSGWLSLAFLLARSYNFIFLISNFMLEASFNSIANTSNFSHITRAILYVNFAQSAFYNQGNSNLLSSIDIRPAFFGQTNYNIFLAIPLVAIATYSTQIYWHLKMFQRIQEVGKSSVSVENSLSSNVDTVKLVSDFTINRNFLSLGYYIYVCVVLRNHLFVWSVISPKLLYHLVSNNILLFAILTISNFHRFKLRQFLEQAEAKQQVN